MIRVKKGNNGIKHHKKILKLAKGFFAAHSKLFRTANTKIIKAFQYSYIGRKQKKRFFKNLWLSRINATILHFKIKSYTKFISKLKNNKINLNKKMLSQLMIINPKLITKLLQHLIK